MVINVAGVRQVAHNRVTFAHIEGLSTLSVDFLHAGDLLRRVDRDVRFLLVLFLAHGDELDLMIDIGQSAESSNCASRLASKVAIKN